MNSVLIEFEERIGKTPPEACKVLGVAYSTYAQYRSGLRDLPEYHLNHIDTLRYLRPGALKFIVRERTNGESDKA